MLTLLLLLAALVCFIAAAANAPVRVNLTATGLAILTVWLMVSNGVMG